MRAGVTREDRSRLHRTRDRQASRSARRTPQRTETGLAREAILGAARPAPFLPPIGSIVRPQALILFSHWTTHERGAGVRRPVLETSANRPLGPLRHSRPCYGRLSQRLRVQAFSVTQLVSRAAGTRRYFSPMDKPVQPLGRAAGRACAGPAISVSMGCAMIKTASNKPDRDAAILRIAGLRHCARSILHPAARPGAAGSANTSIPPRRTARVSRPSA